MNPITTAHACKLVFECLHQIIDKAETKNIEGSTSTKIQRLIHIGQLQNT